MQRLILTIIAAFIMAIVLGPIVIPWLRRMKLSLIHISDPRDA